MPLSSLVRRIIVVALTATMLAGCILFERFTPLAADQLEESAETGPGDTGEAGDVNEEAGSSDAWAKADAADGACGACAVDCVLGHCAVSRPRMPDSADEAPSDGTNAVACPTLGGDAYGQDCNYRSNVPTFIKNDTIAVDTVTGLVWERSSPVGTFDYNAALHHCEALASRRIEGFPDWRLPTAREALTIANSGKNGCALDQSVFDSKENAAILTSTIFNTNPARIYALGGNYAIMLVLSTADALPGIHCVRGRPLSTGALTISASTESVSDPKTGLVWQRSFTGVDKTWKGALGYCEALVLDGHDDWRLPSFKELWSIIDTSRSFPAIDIDAFPATPSEAFWTSSPFANFPQDAYAVNFKDGVDFNIGYPMLEPHRVRCVYGATP